MAKEDMAADRKLQQSAMVLWLLAAILAVVLAVMLLFYRNPWLSHRINAEQVDAGALEILAQTPSPYVRLDDIDLTFTGCYETDRDNNVCAYCYIGAIGDSFFLIRLPAEDGGALLETAKEDREAKRFTGLSGELSRESGMAEYLAQSEGMTAKDYRSYYKIVDVELLCDTSSQERVRIYQLMMVVLAVGALAVGTILWSESGILKERGQASA